VARLSKHSTKDLTRRGSLAYYLAAWVCGTFFFVAAHFLGQPSTGRYLPPASRSFLFQYFFDLVTGWFGIFLLGFLLRLLARKLRWSRALAWTLSGGVLTILLGAVLALLPGSWITRAEWLQFLKEIFELGDENGFRPWGGRAIAAGAMILAGMATAFVLFRVEHAFSKQEDASN
jgi:hypothetical protein